MTIPTIAWVQIAQKAPERGLICHNGTGIYQLYAWHIPTQTVTPLTQSPYGVTTATLSADGETVYYLGTEQAEPIGHFFRIGFDGTQPLDLTPDYPPYSSLFVTESYSGRFFGFMTLNQYGFQAFVADSKKGTTPHLRYENPHFMVAPFLSYDGEITLIASTDREPNTFNFALESYNTRTSELHHTLYYRGTQIRPIGFANREFDMRFLAVMKLGEWERPFLWNARTGERYDFAWEDIAGDFDALDWSSDGRHLLMTQTLHNVQTLFRYDTVEKLLIRLEGMRRDGHPYGTIDSAHIMGKDSIFALWQAFDTPPRIIELSLKTGKFVRDVFVLSDEKGIYAQHLTAHNANGWYVASKNGQVVVYLHSEPIDPLRDSYLRVAQSITAQGNGFLAINYKMPTPLKGILALIDTLPEGVQVWLMGASFGGTLALTVAGQLGNRIKGVCVIDGVADWRTYYAETDPFTQHQLKRAFNGLPDEVVTRYETLSPLTHLATLQAEALLIATEESPMGAQMTALQQALITQEKPHTWVIAPQTDALLDHLNHLLAFIARTI